MGPPDPIIGLNEAFKQDKTEDKILLGVGAYRDDQGKPWVLPVVREAERRVLDAEMNHEYAGISGDPEFNSLSIAFALGKDSPALAEGRVATVQSLSGTGSCRLVGEFINRHRGEKTIYLPEPTWGNHIPIMRDAGLEVRRYRYIDPLSNGLDAQGFLEDLDAAPKGSAVMLHACAHNPTGVDPTPEQWAAVSDVCKGREHLVFFDCAYQGFASGDAERDAFAVRHFVEQGHNIMLAQSFAKNFGLYGERIGALSAVCADAEEAARVESQLKIVARPMYSNPPIYGARLVCAILSDPALEAQWRTECKTMAARIIEMRTELRSKLEDSGSELDWAHVTDQIGMFCYSGLSPEQVDALRVDHAIYLTRDGRISMAGVTTANVQKLATAMHHVTSE